MGYKAVLDSLNKNVELYLQSKCDPALGNLSKALADLTREIEREFKEQRRLIEQLGKDQRR